MSPPASALRLLALLSLLPCAAATAQTIHDTGTVKFEVLGDGFLGASGVFGGAGFRFDGQNGLFEGQLLVGASENQVSGNPYAGASGQPPPEWVNRTGPLALTPPFPIPFEEFDEGYEASYDDSNALSGDGPIGVTVAERSYSAEGAPNNDFVVFSFEVTNTSGADLHGIYVGIWADFDVGNFTWNLGNYDEGTRLLYFWDTTDRDTDYFGLSAINGNISGWELDTFGGTNPDWDVLAYGAMSSGSGGPPLGQADLKAILGTGPYDLPAGGTTTVSFAFVAGEDEADILANAQAARNTLLVANEGTATAVELRLHDAYPNPFARRTNIAFSLEKPQAVRVSVYDALGREAAVLADGMQAAGTHALVWDASALASGVYVVRLDAEGGSLVRRVLLVR
jgi:hypothetical protein